MKKGVKSWNGKWISKAGKEILIKSVAQALPSYAMNVFLLPLQLCHEMEQIMCKYWWQTYSAQKKGIHWMSWEKLVTHKGKGALGHNPSFVWRSIMETQHLINEGCRWSIVSGSTIDVLNQPWLPSEENPFISSVHPGLEGIKVSQLMESGSRKWDEDLLADLFNERDKFLIQSIMLSDDPGDDQWYWNKEATGIYSVKSAYKLLQVLNGRLNEQSNSGLWRSL